MLKIIAFSSSSSHFITHMPTRNVWCLLTQPLHFGWVSILISFNSPLIMPPSWHTCQPASKMLYSLGFLPSFQFFSYPWSLLLILPKHPIPTASSLRVSPQNPWLPVSIHFFLSLPTYSSHICPPSAPSQFLYLVNYRLYLASLEHLSNGNLKSYRSQTNFQTYTTQTSCSTQWCRIFCSALEYLHLPSPPRVLGVIPQITQISILAPWDLNSKTTFSGTPFLSVLPKAVTCPFSIWYNYQ